ncbi:trehalose operon repressor [Streptococcus sp. DD13]|uniref:trehalose operon repressor n=1 Tax=Streptococcus sp. DD13 TaxID=1777881 RepID=UPI00079BA4EA|nr:trehalose operon repressor [Streptococcus sp. DD13]KXT77951.1 Trehalose operon transcriptional repressor [Streptococcus sp. DD13]
MKKYQHLLRQLKEKIQNDIYPVGSFLPSEHDLMEEYHYSRDTIRKALSLLQEEGLIRKVQGQGSQVIKEETVNFPVSKLTSYQELVQELGLDSKTNVVRLDKIIIDQKTARLTGFPEYRRVWKVVRQRIVDNLVSVLDTDYLDMELVPNLQRDIAEKSIYAYIEQELKLRIDYAEKEITIDTSQDRDKILMDIGKDPFVVSVKSKVYLRDGRQFQFTESRHKLEKFRFVDFARRR